MTDDDWRAVVDVNLNGYFFDLARRATLQEVRRAKGDARARAKQERGREGGGEEKSRKQKE